MGYRFVFRWPVMKAGFGRTEVRGKDVYSVVFIVAAIGRIDRDAPGVAVR